MQMKIILRSYPKEKPFKIPRIKKAHQIRSLLSTQPNPILPSPPQRAGPMSFPLMGLETRSRPIPKCSAGSGASTQPVEPLLQHLSTINIKNERPSPIDLIHSKLLLGFTMESKNTVVGNQKEEQEQVQVQDVVTKKKRRVKIAKIEAKSSLQVTFSKRRLGLFRKADKLRSLFRADVGIVVYSPGGKAFAHPHPTNDAVLRRLFAYLDQSNGFWWDKVDIAKIEGKEELEQCVRALEAARKTVLARANEMADAAAIETFLAGLPRTPPPDEDQFLINQHQGHQPPDQLLLINQCQSPQTDQMFDHCQLMQPESGDHQKQELENEGTAEVDEDCESDCWKECLCLDDFVCVDY